MRTSHRVHVIAAGPSLAAGPDFAACPNLGNGSFAAVPGLCRPKVGLHIGPPHRSPRNPWIFGIFGNFFGIFGIFGQILGFLVKIT